MCVCVRALKRHRHKRAHPAEPAVARLGSAGLDWSSSCAYLSKLMCHLDVVIVMRLLPLATCTPLLPPSYALALPAWPASIPMNFN